MCYFVINIKNYCFYDVALVSIPLPPNDLILEDILYVERACALPMLAPLSSSCTTVVEGVTLTFCCVGVKDVTLVFCCVEVVC
jgi:hypothetical protein